MPHPETQIPMARPHPTPQKHNSPNTNPNGTAQQTADLTKCCACAVKSSSTLQHLTFPHDSSISHESDTSRFHPKPSPKASPNGNALARWPKTVSTASRNATYATIARGHRLVATSSQLPCSNAFISLLVSESFSASVSLWHGLVNATGCISSGTAGLFCCDWG